MIKEYLKYRRVKRHVESIMQINRPETLRDFLLDSRFPAAQQLSALLGLPEVTEEAVVASNTRTERLKELMPLAGFFASALSTGVMEYYDTVAPWAAELSVEERRSFEVWVAQLNLSCTLGVLSQFEDLGLIKVIR